MSQGYISSDGKLSERALELIRLFLEKASFSGKK